MKSMLTSTLYRYIYSKSSISTYVALFIASKWLTHAYAEAHLFPLFGLATSGEDNATDYIILGGRDGTGKQGKPTHLTSVWQQVGRACGCRCLCLSVPIAIPLAQSLAQGGFSSSYSSFRLHRFQFRFRWLKNVLVIIRLEKCCELCLCCGACWHLSLVCPTLFQLPLPFLLFLLGLVDVTIVISLAAAAPELGFLNCFLSLYLLLNWVRSFFHKNL